MAKCQKCKQTINKEKVIKLEIRSKKWKLCEDCAEQAQTDEDYRNLPPCNNCRKPVHDEDMMTLKNGEIIHEKCYEGEYGDE